MHFCTLTAARKHFIAAVASFYASSFSNVPIKTCRSTQRRRKEKKETKKTSKNHPFFKKTTASFVHIYNNVLCFVTKLYFLFTRPLLDFTIQRLRGLNFFILFFFLNKKDFKANKTNIFNKLYYFVKSPWNRFSESTLWWILNFS